MGMPPDLKVIAEGMIKASMGMVTTVMPGARDTTIAHVVPRADINPGEVHY
ncbi:hypothetical protein [Streptomyces broussonetiae]|uniref:Uncharacterized protein n=1 Tax=Streptomyces broussonetiae TaxID=2686304 RepID=A0A6I6MUN5_9ACTN|nr:hypothetical protein [Streptomyces broussonetiae]QHA02019.1 hypothetical protein GQF42_00270 [Streptomyces broussonetiae]